MIWKDDRIFYETAKRNCPVFKIKKCYLLIDMHLKSGGLVIIISDSTQAFIF